MAKPMVTIKHDETQDLLNVVEYLQSVGGEIIRQIDDLGGGVKEFYISMQNTGASAGCVGVVVRFTPETLTLMRGVLPFYRVSLHTYTVCNIILETTPLMVDYILPEIPQQWLLWEPIDPIFYKNVSPHSLIPKGI